MSTVDTKPRRTRLARWTRRTLRLLAIGALLLAVLLVAAWFFRGQLVAPLVRPRLETMIAQALGARRVSIGALDGDWLSAIDVKDVHIEGAAQPPFSLHGARIEARYSLWALLGGDLEGLRTAKVTIREAELDLRPSPEPGEPAAGPASPFDVRSLDPLLRLLPEGASAHIEELRVLAPQGERQGPLDLALRADGDGRELVVSHAGLTVRARLPAPSTHREPLRVAAHVDAADPGAMLDLFGLGAGVREGELHAEVDACSDPWRLDARIDLRELVHGDERLARSHVTARLDGGGLFVERASVDLPGVTAELQAVNLPNLFAGGATILQDLTGQFAVRVDDLSPHAALLPEAVRTLLPIRGEFRGTAAGGQLRLDPCELQARGALLRIERGSFPLPSGDWHSAEGSLHGVLTLDGFTHELPWLGNTTLSGRVAGTIAGSATAPRFAVDFDFGGCRSERGSLAHAAGLVRADPGSIVAEGLRVEGLRDADPEHLAPTGFRLDANCRLRSGELDPDSLVANLELDSDAVGEWLAPVFAENALGPAPAGTTTLELRARHGASGIEIETMHVRTAVASPVEVAIDGDGILPLHWSGTQLAVLETGEFALHARVARPAVGETPPLSFAGTLRLDGRSAALREMVATAGAATLQGEIVSARGLAALLDPDADLGATALQLDLALEELDLAKLPAAWFGGVQIGGRLAGTVRTAGPARHLEPRLLLTLDDGVLHGPGVPSVADARLRLEISGGDPAAPAFVLAATGSASLAPEFAPNRAFAFTANARCDENGAALGPATLRIGGGEVTIELASDLRGSQLRDALAGGVAIGANTLTGKVGLREFSLAHVPAAWLPTGPLKGTAHGEIVLDGTLATASGPVIVRSATLSLRGGGMKLGGMPSIEHIDAELACDQHALTLRSLTGTLGAGKLAVQGSIRQDKAPLAESFADAALELKVTGEDVLLFRGEGAQVRATVNTTATGTLQAVAVTGEVVLGRGSKFVRRLSLLPDLSTRGGATASEGLRLFEVPPPIGDRIRLDVAIQTREPFEVRANVFEGEIDVAARLRGTAAVPRLEGTMAMRKGVLRFPGANLRVDSGLLTFTPSDPLFPQLMVKAEAKRMGIVISVSVTGRYDQPQVLLSSVPPLPPQDLLVLLTTGQLPSTLAERGAEGQARFVGGYLAKEIFDSWFGSDSPEKGASAFDRLTIESGREVSKNGVESVIVEYELSPRLAVQVERDSYEDYNLGLVLRFRFR